MGTLRSPPTNLPTPATPVLRCLFYAVTLLLITALSQAAGSGAQSGQEPVGSSSGLPTDLLADSVEVWSCDFTEDVNYDLWPDRWTRLEDDDHPHYSKIKIVNGAGPDSERALVIFPDGASARATSPLIHVLPKFSYIVTFDLNVRGVEHGKLVVRAELLDASGETLQLEPQEIELESGWQRVALEAFQPRDPEIDRVLIHFDFVQGDRADLRARIALANVSMSRQPSIRIHTDSEYNVYSNPEDVEVTCSLSGILERNPEIRFQLLDATNRDIGKVGVLELDGRIISESSAMAKDIVDGFAGHGKGYEGSIKWNPPISDFGFYRVRVQMISSETQTLLKEESVTVAVVPEQLESGGDGEFGWSLPDGDSPLSFETLTKLLPLVGVNVVKVPVWYPVDDEERGGEIIRFAELLAARDIGVVGVLEDPTDRIKNPLWEGVPSPVEGLLAREPSEWIPLIDHVIAKLSLRIRWWQLGRDGDTSFVGYERLVESIFQIRNNMFRFGQDIRIGIGWRWDHMRDWGRQLSWDFEQMSGRESTDAIALDTELTAATPTTAQRWVLVEPPATPADATTELERHQGRVRDFVEQIIVAKVHGVDGVFVPNPFSGMADPAEERFGVMNEDGTPGELLLPWRTCSRLLGGAKYLGSITLPYGSKNWLFKRSDGRIVMVLWSQDAADESVDEVIYLGDKVRHYNIWGKSREIPEVDGRQVIRVSRMPSFVMGLNEGIARLRMSLNFSNPSVPSVFAVPHQLQLRIHNDFGQGVGGVAKITFPDLSATDDLYHAPENSEWRLSTNEGRFSIPAGETWEFPLEVIVQGAEFGPHRVRIDFDLVADKEYKFSVWRVLNVGLGDLDLEVTTHLTEEGRLIVRQIMRSTSDKVSDFKCLLYHGGRRKRAQVFQLSDLDKKTYTYLNGREMLGESLRLQIEEINGQRIIIHRFIAEDMPLPKEDQDKGDLLNFENEAG